jgi:hypothetical protein
VMAAGSIAAMADAFKGHCERSEAIS